MERTEYKLDIDASVIRQALSALSVPTEEIFFFDIETTGLSPRVSSLYLIGVCYFDGESAHLAQWFADDYISEKEILFSFLEFTERFSTCIHYNGSTFDIPYLQKKYDAYKLPSPFEGKESLDIYREVRKKKDLFQTPDFRLSTVEKLLGFQREDNFSGKDCIRLYTEFMQKKYFRDKKAGELKNFLLHHNRDDLIGTALCSRFLLYSRYQPVHPRCHIENDMLVITDDTAVPLPFAGEYKRENQWIRFTPDTIVIKVPLYQGTLFHFYPDYKNYFYLPKEDMAVHKSVGIYVDSEFREKATASNCYLKKTGVFLPLPKGFSCGDFPLFQESKKSRRLYLYWENSSFTLKEDFLAEYIRFVF